MKLGQASRKRRATAKRVRRSPGQRERHILRWLGFGLLAAVSLWWLLLSPSPDWVEATYSRGFYAWLAGWLVPVTNSVPFSLAGLLLVGLPLLWFGWLTVSFRRFSFWEWLGRWVFRTVIAAITVYGLFLVIWGMNYGREPIEDQLGLWQSLTTEADLLRLVDGLERTFLLTYRASRNPDAALDSVRQALQTTVRDLTTVTPSLPVAVKRLPVGSLILLGSASGVISPWTLEPHIDGALSDVASVAVGAHELAHIAGYAGEADADFVAALAGLQSENAFVRYAVALWLWHSANWQLPEAQARANYEALPLQVRQDYDAMLEPFRRYRLPDVVRAWQRGVYDGYLKTQRVEGGIQDYSRVVNLLIRAQKQGLIF